MGLERVHLVGHSMGGVVAHLLAAAHPGRVDHLVVEDVVPAVREEVGTTGPHWWDLLDAVTAPTLPVGGGPASHIPQEHLAEGVRRLPPPTC